MGFASLDFATKYSASQLLFENREEKNPYFTSHVQSWCIRAALVHACVALVDTGVAFVYLRHSIVGVAQPQQKGAKHSPLLQVPKSADLPERRAC